MASSQEAQSAVSGALVAIWRIEFLSYNLVPSARAEIEKLVQKWTDKVNKDDAAWMGEQGDAELRALKKTRKMIEMKRPVASFSESLKYGFFYFTNERLNKFIELVETLIDGFERQHAARLRSQPGGPLDRFLLERKRNLQAIKDEISKKEDDGSLLRPDQVDSECTALARLQLEAIILVEKNVKLKSYWAAFQLHDVRFQMYRDLIEQVLDVSPTLHRFNKVNRIAEKSKQKLQRERSAAISDAEFTRDKANKMADIEERMRQGYIKLAEYIKYMKDSAEPPKSQGSASQFIVQRR